MGHSILELDASKPCLGNTHTSSFGSSPTFVQRACGLLPWRAMAGFLLLTLAVALSAPAHADTLATNLDTLLTNQDGYFLHAVEVSDYDHEGAPVGIAQKFSTGSNASGYTLSSMTICMVWFDPVRSVPKVSIYTAGSDGNPGTSKYVLTNPTLKHAGYGDDFTVCDPDGLNSFTAPSNAVLDPSTDYFVVFENDGTQATVTETYSAYNIGKVLSGAEGLGASGWSLGDTEHRKNTPTSSWTTPGATTQRPVRMKIEGTAGGLTDTTAPILDSATVDTRLLVLTYNEALDEDSAPATSAYSVSVDGGTGAAPSSVDVTGMKVTLRLERAVIEGQTVTVSYTAPTSNPVQDISDNDAQSFTDETVDNQSTVTPYRPRPPTDLTASTDGSTRIDLSWTAPVDNGGRVIEGYQIEWSPDGRTSGLNIIWNDVVANTNTADTTYTVTGLSPGTTRYYRVKAINSVGTGEHSNVVIETTPTTDGTPSPPQQPSARDNGKTRIDLSWTAPGYTGNSPVTGYKIEVSTDGGNNWDDLEVDTGSTDTTYEHTGLSPSTTRHYRVSAINTIGPGLVSEVVSATTTPRDTPDVPNNLRAVPGNGRVTLMWDAPDDNGGSSITGYEWRLGYPNPESGATFEGWNLASFGDDTSLERTIQGLHNGQTYVFELRAYNEMSTATEN